MSRALRIALPKGRMMDEALRLFEAMGSPVRATAAA